MCLAFELPKRASRAVFVWLVGQLGQAGSDPTRSTADETNVGTNETNQHTHKKIKNKHL
jgi:hypothetical protein